MIAANYARKSCLYLLGRSHWLLSLVVVISCLEGHAGAEERPLTYEDYQAGSALATKYFWPVYSELGVRARYEQILLKCGYKKEADDLAARTEALIKTKLDAITEQDIESGKIKHIGTVLLGREGANDLWVGYRIGFGEGFSLLSDQLPARTYEAVCKSTLGKVRGMLEEVAK